MSNTSNDVNMDSECECELEIPLSQKRLGNIGHNEKDLEGLYQKYLDLLIPDLPDKDTSNNNKSKENKNKK